MHTTSLPFSKLLVEKMGGVKVEPSFWWSVPVPERGKSAVEINALEHTKTELCYRRQKWGGYFDNIPSYTLDELSAVLKEIGEERGGENDGWEQPRLLEWHEYHFFRLCEIYAFQGWEAMEREATKILT